MTVKQAVKYTFLNLFVILLGVFIIFKVWWSHGEIRFLGLFSFFLIGFGCLFLSISLTRIMIPIKTNFNFSTLVNKNKYQLLKNDIGSEKLTTINICYTSLFLILFAGSAYGIVTSVNSYEHYQLKTYGNLQKVKIEDIHSIGKGSKYAFFNFFLKDKKYSNNLPSKNFSIGDSAIIIFSTQNTDVIQWAEDFNVHE